MLKKLLYVLILICVTLGLLAGCDLIPSFGAEPEKVEQVVFDKDEITLKIGESADIYATVLPEEVEDAKLVWESSDESVASVSGGRVTALSEGTTFITATSENGKYAICYITVVRNANTNVTTNVAYMAVMPDAKGYATGMVLIVGVSTLTALQLVR